MSCSSIRLQELGPRLTLELMKVERGLCEGEVLYHSYVTKTAEEVSSDAARVLCAFDSKIQLLDYHCCCLCSYMELVDLETRGAEVVQCFQILQVLFTSWYHNPARS